MLRGANIIAVDLNLDGARQTASEVEKMGQKVLACQVDVSNKLQVESMVQEAVGVMGRIDTLVNSAGIFSRGSFIDISEDEWDRMMDINVKGTSYAARQF